MQIAFLSTTHEGKTDIHIVDIYNRNETALTTDGTEKSKPVWSPDGKYIAFNTFVGGSSNRPLVIADVKKLTSVKLFPDGYTRFPSWSPDSLRILVSSDYQLFATNVDGSGLIMHNNASHGIGFSAWSPDGKYIAFVQHSSESKHKLSLINADGTNLRTLAEISNGSIEDLLAWSPNSDRILFILDGHIYSVSPSGGKPIKVTKSGLNQSPSWSPDGKRIVFSSSRESFLQIYVIHPDGSAETQLTNVGSNRSPVWSSNGRLIAFASDRDGDWHIYTMESDGSNLSKITKQGSNTDPVWKP